MSAQSDSFSDPGRNRIGPLIQALLIEKGCTNSVTGLTTAQIVEAAGISQSAVSKVVRNKYWAIFDCIAPVWPPHYWFDSREFEENKQAVLMQRAARLAADMKATKPSIPSFPEIPVKIEPPVPMAISPVEKKPIERPLKKDGTPYERADLFLCLPVWQEYLEGKLDNNPENIKHQAIVMRKFSTYMLWELQQSTNGESA